MPFYDSGSVFGAFSIGFSRNPREDFAVYARGYFKAAHDLATSLLERPHGFPDYNAYPVMFLYRHCLELYLKACIYNSDLLSFILSEPELDHALINDHRLLPLSRKAARVLNKLFPQDASLASFCTEFKQIAQEFEVIDRNSFAFRYPITKDGASPFPENTVFNLVAVRSAFETLYQGFDAIDFGLDTTTQRCRDWYPDLPED
jgi:hypothetical protein